MTGDSLIFRALRRGAAVALLFLVPEGVAAPAEGAGTVRGRVVLEAPEIKFRRTEHGVLRSTEGELWSATASVVAGPVCERRDGLVVALQDGSLDRYCLGEDGAAFQQARWGTLPERSKPLDVAVVTLDAAGTVGVAALYQREHVHLAPLVYPPNLIPSVEFPLTAPTPKKVLPERQLVSFVYLLKPVRRGAETSFEVVTRGRFGYPDTSKLYTLDLEGDGLSDLVGLAFAPGRSDYSILRRDEQGALNGFASGGFDTPIILAGATTFDSVRGDRFYFIGSDPAFGGTTIYNTGLLFSPKDALLMRWAMLPFATGWRDAVSGDFNGDGQGDVLVRGNPISGWWMAFGNRASYAVERSIRGPWGIEQEPPFMLAGDFDGNGLTEIVRPTPDLRGLLRFEGALPTPLADVEVVAPGGVTARTDAQGRFALRCNESPCELSFRKPDYRFGVSDAVNVKSVREQIVLAQREEVLKKESSRPHRLGIDADGPYACLAYSPGYERRWGLMGDRGCPPDYAYLAVDDGAGTRTNSERLWTNGLCCRLPRGVLTEERMEAPFECPDGWVGAGGRNTGDNEDSFKPIICAKIDTERFRLGPRFPGSYWGTGQSMRGQDRVRSLSEINISLRVAIQRRAFNEFDMDGCVGDPPGSIMVNKGRGMCKTFAFRQLLYRGVPGDPPDGTPVPLLPNCSALENIYDPSSGCRE